MWECRKCGEPVFFAERKQSLGFDWHPGCLRCEECAKRLNPGQHAEHKGVPYCHHPCYGALFGPQLFGHGTRNECHTSFGKVVNRDGQVKRSHLETSLKNYNQAYEGKPGELKSREANGQLILEGVLRIYWGVRNIIHLKEEDANRVTLRRPVSHILDVSMYNDSDDEDHAIWRDNSPNPSIRRHSSHGSTGSNTERFELQIRKPGVTDKSRETNGNTDPSLNPVGKEEIDIELNNGSSPYVNGTAEKASPVRTGNTAIRRRPGRRMEKTKLKRRCSINGHFYLRETSSFTPPFGSPCSLWITSKTTAEEVLNMLLDKYKVEMPASNFALFIVKDTGEQRKIKVSDSPLETRVLLGSNEDVAKVFIMDAHKTQEISQEVAQFLNLSLVECRAILLKYEEEEVKLLNAIKSKYEPLRMRIIRCLKDRELQQNI